VSWPTPPSAALAPVSAPAGIQPVQSEGREGQSDLEYPPRARGTRARADEEARAATPPGASDAEPKASAQARQGAAAQRAEQAVKKAEADKASHRKAMDRLQEVLTNMWAASAAVVDHALGLEPKAEALPGNQSDTAPDLSAVAASTMPRRLLPGAKTADAPGQTAPENMPWPVMPQSTDEAAAELAPEVPGGEVIAYDENGQSSLAPLEVGTLLSEKV
jgi:hypothetical protein